MTGWLEDKVALYRRGDIKLEAFELFHCPGRRRSRSRVFKYTRF